MNDIKDWFGWAFCEPAFCLFETEELDACIMEIVSGSPANIYSIRGQAARILYRIGCWFYSLNCER